MRRLGLQEWSGLAMFVVSVVAGGPVLAGQILLSPMLDVCVATASLRAAGAGHDSHVD